MSPSGVHIIDLLASPNLFQFLHLNLASLVEVHSVTKGFLHRARPRLATLRIHGGGPRGNVEGPLRCCDVLRDSRRVGRGPGHRRGSPGGCEIILDDGGGISGCINRRVRCESAQGHSRQSRTQRLELK